MVLNPKDGSPLVSQVGALLGSHLPFRLSHPSQHTGILCSVCVEATLFVIAFLFS